MNKSHSDSYASSGVDVTAGYKAVELMKKHVASTLNSNVLSGLGGFGAMYQLDLDGITKPILVSGTDGVGTKLKLAFMMDKHDSIGIDCVAMCVNDVLCCGAKPLFFLDYVATGKVFPEKIAQIVAGVAQGCRQADAALIGGETAEMPGFYPIDEYDLAGFCVGVVDKEKIINPNKTQKGDVLIALASSGVHSNGFSLIRKVFALDKSNITKRYNCLDGATLGETLLTPTQIYVKPLLQLLSKVDVKGIAHITGGGFYENIPRSLPNGLAAHIKRLAVQTPPIFDLIASTGNIPQRDMFNTFNMGVGMTVTVAPSQVQQTLAILNGAGATAYTLGEIVNSEDGVIIE